MINKVFNKKKGGLVNHTFLKQEMVLHNKNPETKPDCCKHVLLMEMALFLLKAERFDLKKLIS